MLDRNFDKYTESNVLDTIHFLTEWIEIDLTELNGDNTSGYAKWILSKHKYLQRAIDCCWYWIGEHLEPDEISS